MQVSYVILTSNRKDDLKICLDSLVGQQYSDIEIIVIDNNSTDGTAGLMEEYPAALHVRLDYNSGVCKGRNIGFNRAGGDIIVVIDDDGELPDPHVTSEIVRGFVEKPDMGIMAMRVVNPKDPNCRRVIPSTNKNLANSQEVTPVAYFPGGGMAVRREVLAEVGMFPEEYFYGMEELDMAYRVAKTQWQIYYFPQVRILHHESLHQRPSWRRYYYEYRNRIWMAVSFLPWRYLFIYLTLWGGMTLGKSIRYGYACHFFRGIRDAKKGLLPFKVRRRKMLLKPAEIRRVKRLYGRLYY